MDFGDARDISGIKMQGLHGSDSWVEAFQVSYGNDGHQWSIIKEKTSQTDRIFMGNYDSNSIVAQYFDKIINARYLRITPLKWHKNIGLRIEIIGCYVPYKPDLSEKQTTITTSKFLPQQPEREDCSSCPGLPRAFINDSACFCSAGLVWDGKACTPLELCPCYVDHIR